MAAVAADADDVLVALRLGWAVAELRGRLRSGDKLIPIEPLSTHLRNQHALPLGSERKELEFRSPPHPAIFLAAAGRKPVGSKPRG